MNPEDPNAAYVVGVDIGGTYLRLALAGSNGIPVARWSTTTSGICDPNEIITLILEGIDALLAESHLSRAVLRALGIGAPGITDVDRGIVLATSYLVGWRNVPLQVLLESALGVPTQIDNDVNLATLAEALLGDARGVPNFAFLAIGTGVGAGLYLRNQLYRGSSWLAGEIGYMLVPGVSEASVAEGAPGALESLAGGHAIRTAWQELTRTDATVSHDLTPTQIFDLAANGHPAAIHLLHRTSRLLASAVYNLCLILDVPLVVFGGGVGTHPALLDAVRVELASRLHAATPHITSSVLGSDAQLLGAIQLALQISAIS